AAFPKHASSPQQLISCADTAMYEAKAAHKNCVRFASGIPSRDSGKPEPTEKNSSSENSSTQVIQSQPANDSTVN
ncbi:MAG TPA: hypothetical protein VFH91_01785, partial [Pyrinomonadaceae bacterium]|nr:hypothetical protein [Pyrinomonadaceae bacterium]